MNIVQLSSLKDLSISTIPLAGLKGARLAAVKSLPYKKSAVLPFRRMIYGRDQFQAPEYDLYEVSSAEDAEGIIRRAIQKKRGYADKEGWELMGNNPRTIEYIKHRFLEISLCQNMPLELLVKDTVGDLFRYHNAFWKKVRDEKISSGSMRKVKTMGGTKNLKPVCAYFRIPAETMEVKTDAFGNPKQYRQVMPDGRYVEFNVEDVIHFVFNRKAGMLFASPGLLPAIDDARALRRMEENVELLIEQNLFPLFVMQIGTDEWPIETMADGTSEVDVWTEKIEQMPKSGGLVVSHRHKFDIIEPKHNLQVEKYLEHFKKRLYTSAGVSGLDMGEGDGMNRSTADNASKILMEDVKDYQKEFQYQFQFNVIYELLLEKYDATVLMKENVVEFKWHEVDLENMMKLENHNALMYNMNYKTEDEARAKTGHKPLNTPDDRSKMYMNQVELPKINTTAQAKVSAATGVKNAKNRNAPANQHGKALGPTHRKSSMPANMTPLMTVLNDFQSYSRDLTKIRLRNWIFSIDLSALNEDVYSQLSPVLDDIVDNAYDSISADNTTPTQAKDLMVERLNTLLTFDETE